VDRAVGYGIAGHSVDGTDLEQCIEVVGGAVEQARQGEGPQMIVASLLRLCGHGEHDDAGYIDPLLKASKIGRDCLNVAEEFILNNNWADATELALWRKNTLLQIEEAIATTQREPAPDPGKEDWCALASRHLIDGFLNE